MLLVRNGRAANDPIADIRAKPHRRLMISSKLAQTLRMLADATSVAEGQWWVIGSAAVALHGGHVTDVRDVDLLMSETDAQAFLQKVGASWRKGEPSERFYSPVFGIWDEPPMSIEAFGGFRLATEDSWRKVTFATHQAINVAGCTVFVPSKTELRALLYSMGRPKDFRRAELLGA
ncbi:MAG: hypothetical protein VX512_03820 [Pseudomonadota bacterium]|nr:hypothetical protein [Pseudomonadota bacterium]